MSSNRCIPDSRPGHSVRERRAHIACTRCRHLKKKCKQGAGADCQRCNATGQECQYLRVVDEISQMANNSPPPAAEPIILEPANTASPFQDDEMYAMQLQSPYLDIFGASNTNPQPPTTETSYFSDIIQDTPSYHYASNIELFIPNAQAGTSDPRSASGASVTYNQYIDARSYILRCSVCSAGYQCVAHTPGSNYL